MRVEIAGTGRALPAAMVSSATLDAHHGLPEGRIFSLTGVAERAICQDESQIDLAVAAAQAALDDAGIRAEEISLIIGASAVPYQPIPATAPLVMARLGIADGQAAAFDVNSTCLSFLTGFETAARMISQGGTALVFSSELASRALPWAQAPEIAGLFGDGAAAAILRPAKGPARIAACLMRSYPSAYEACGIGAGGTRFDFTQEPEAFAEHAFFAMEGRTLFRLAAQYFGGFVTDLLDRAGWQHSDVDLVIPHQASPAALAHMIRQTGFAAERVVNIAADYGNQIAASIPFTLDLARRQGRIRPGMRVLFLGTSAGVSFGGMALEV
ncbi:3-oxoacyl-[acyl-carrier-protein] synthase III C-terminal domain-containing protein [Xinfangfangia sp. CPCC 101601]|uniref:3-oxoacyl-[acyl-carrier-protein] synthase III C-terminal domain-containing protein n=1 Tax=Pseudogemmobacter lacusdianii TaxID=3069608 RepID=A0ABU0W1F4_9RHOB|nr:3-oxoacyl-[acyl-carrier-protein] synthase III C-terminal domain-containing protein [Xinfangfangia sp. CPCC 101601]MDQ2067834.1 3-oxoacyl-[acyl-carrier-protein] synthase III C-terminal domain-containing protein [Xinfangfangia sp. CPCC 101601]